MITRWGLAPLAWTTLVLAGAVWLLPGGVPRLVGAAVAAILWLGTVYFFRDPERRPRGEEADLVAPADGVIADLEEVEGRDGRDGRHLRIGIFLSVLDVHLNRAPVTGTVIAASYTPGRFLDARHPAVSHENEVNSLAIAVDRAVAPGVVLLVRQLSGLIARRIVCAVTSGDRLVRGQRFGMIRFGSRTELWIPVAALDSCRVAVGDRVRGGETVVARLVTRTEGTT